MKTLGARPNSRRSVAALFLMLVGLSGCQSLDEWTQRRFVPDAPTETASVRAGLGPPTLPSSEEDTIRQASFAGGDAGKKPMPQRREADLAESPPVVPAPVAEQAIDLETALLLAGVDNPTIALAQEAVRASLAEQLQARALLLPTLEAGVSFNLHRGNLQNSEGIIRDVNRQSLYGGTGAAAVGAGTVGFPGVRLTAHLTDALFEPIATRQAVTARRFDAQAVRNTILLLVTTRYLALAEAETRLQLVRQSERDLSEIVKITADFALVGQGREGDAERARSEALLLHVVEQRVEEDVAVAAAELARVLNLDTAVRLRVQGAVPLVQLIDPRDSLAKLVEIALSNRPEVGARTADVAVQETRLRKERVRPFVPFLSVGFSAGEFGGGSNQADTRFGDFASRTDFDVLAVWSLQNFGLGNLAMQRRQRALVGQALAERARIVDVIRREVAEAHALSAARRREFEVARQRVETAQRAYQLDLARARNIVEKARAIEVLNSANLLTAARQDLIRALVAYDQAQFQLFVALGRPPDSALRMSECHR